MEGGTGLSEAQNMTKAVVIRKAMAADAPGLLAMAEALTRYHDDEPRLTPASVARDLFGDPAWFHALVAEVDGTLVGYAALLPLARLGYGERGLDLHHLFVIETARRAGVGTALVRAAEDLGRDLGCGYLIIGTHPGNWAAQEYYQRLGYGPMPNTAMRFTQRID
jgi:GNAT superfamily N-acetyltransferase